MLMQDDSHSEPMDEFRRGERVVVWSSANDEDLYWELSSVYSCQPQTSEVSMFVPGKRTLGVWVHPEEANIQTVTKAQILIHNVTIKYHKSASIRCSLSREVMDVIEKSLQSFSF